MDLDNYLNNLGFQIYTEFKNNRVFRNDIPIPLNILHEPLVTSVTLYSLIHDHIRFVQLLIDVKVTWGAFLNKNILSGIIEYERTLIEKINQKRIQSELYRMSEAHKLETDIRDINDLISQCSIKHSSVDSLTKCMAKGGISKKKPFKKTKK